MTSTSSDLALVVVAYDSAELLERLLTQTAAEHDGPIVVVDNPSSPGERARVRTLAAREGWEFVGPERNGGFGEGCGAGAERALALGATGLVFLNPDASLAAEDARGLAAALRAEPGTMISPRVLRPDGRPWFAGALLDLTDGRVRPNPSGTLEAHEVPWLSGACLTVSAELWRETAGFDPAYFLYWEDVDLSYRVLRAGGQLAVRSELSAVHEVGGTQRSTGGGKSALYYRMNIRNRTLFARRHLDEAGQARWRQEDRAVAHEILLRGGRRQFLRNPGLLTLPRTALAEGRRMPLDPFPANAN